jgi:cytochrome c2
MEFSKDIYRNGYKSFKPSFETKGVKQFKSCNNCHQRFEKDEKLM